MISATASEKREVLQAITFGKPTAEEEGKDLSGYFVETDQWHKIFAGDIDVVYGPKGAGKSALYALLLSRTSELFDRGIIVVPAENPRGAVAFRDLVSNPRQTNRSFEICGNYSSSYCSPTLSGTMGSRLRIYAK
jgi:ATPase subunit of ABC transporter with duplicated ATPase domains